MSEEWHLGKDLKQGFTLRDDTGNDKYLQLVSSTVVNTLVEGILLAVEFELLNFFKIRRQVGCFSLRFLFSMH